jgi:CheY-like chemotaxis protein
MPGPLRGITILIAEDNAIQAWDLKCLFEESGAEVLGPVKSVPAALSYVKKAKFTCAVLDVMLGRELVYPVAQLLSGRDVGIVFCTGHSDSASLERDFPSAQIILKPAPSAALIDAVRLACAASGAKPTTANIPAGAQ